MRPSPTTTTVSPSSARARRTLLRAMAPSVTNAASLSSTDSGTLTTRLRGTTTYSA